MLRKFASLINLCTLIACVLIMTTGAVAQSQATTGNIEGRVLDPNGAVVPNATVAAKNEATGLAKTTTTDSEGQYRIILLPPGAYTVTAEASGLASQSVLVTVTVGSQSPLDIAVAVAGTNVGNVTVTAEDELGAGLVGVDDGGGLLGGGLVGVVG